jgi:hypothetical protein
MWFSTVFAMVLTLLYVSFVCPSTLIDLDAQALPLMKDMSLVRVELMKDLLDPKIHAECRRLLDEYTSWKVEFDRVEYMDCSDSKCMSWKAWIEVLRVNFEELDLYCRLSQGMQIVEYLKQSDEL